MYFVGNWITKIIDTKHINGTSQQKDLIVFKSFLLTIIYLQYVSYNNVYHGHLSVKYFNYLPKRIVH